MTVPDGSIDRSVKVIGTIATKPINIEVYDADYGSVLHYPTATYQVQRVCTMPSGTKVYITNVVFEQHPDFTEWLMIVEERVADFTPC